MFAEEQYIDKLSNPTDWEDDDEDAGYYDPWERDRLEDEDYA